MTEYNIDMERFKTQTARKVAEEIIENGETCAQLEIKDAVLRDCIVSNLAEFLKKVFK